MSRRRAPYAKLFVWYAVGILALVVVAGFAVAGYEINHLRTEVDSLKVQVNGLNQTIKTLGTLLQAEIARLK